MTSLNWNWFSDDSVTSGSNIENVNLKQNTEPNQMENEVDVVYDDDGDYFNTDGAATLEKVRIAMD